MLRITSIHGILAVGRKSALQSDNFVPAEAPIMPKLARTVSLLAGTVLIVAAPWAAAQTTTLKLTTTQQKACIATTNDPDGVQVEPGGTALVAKGVTLSGDCGEVGDNYQATVKLPPTGAVTGTPFNVVWTASAQATRCTYGGTPGMTGWPVGTDACVGAACAGQHTNTVTVINPVSHSFSVTCTNASGFASSAVTASAPPKPPEPANFALTASTPNPVVNTPVDVSWVVSGADACAGTALLNGTSAALPGWTDAVPASSSPRRVTPAQAGTWSLSLKCSNAHGSTTSAPLNLTVTTSGGDADNCPAGRQTVAEICYGSNLTTNCDRNTNVTAYDNIWGRLSATGTPQPFPAGTGSRIVKNLDKTKYIAAKAANVQLTGNFVRAFFHNSTFRGPNLTMAISDKCGDFNPPNNACLRTNIGGDALMGQYYNVEGSGAGCPLTPGKTYFLNIKATDPSQNVPGDCSGNICVTNIAHN